MYYLIDPQPNNLPPNSLLATQTNTPHRRYEDIMATNLTTAKFKN